MQQWEYLVIWHEWGTWWDSAGRTGKSESPRLLWRLHDL
jgi:hypothetical protein